MQKTKDENNARLIAKLELNQALSEINKKVDPSLYRVCLIEIGVEATRIARVLSQQDNC